jgi:hypothetical protein
MTRWDETLWLFTLAEFEQLPDGIELTSIMGNKAIKGKDYIDDDVRGNYIAYGIGDPLNHPEAQLFTKFLLEGTK